MTMIGPDNIDIVNDAMRIERDELLALLGGLDASDWVRPTECPEYPVKGIATHLLGDDLSLLSRQRDGATQGLVLVAEKLPGVDFRTLLNTFNDQWVEAARFLSPTLLIELLRLSGDWTETYYRAVDPDLPGEPVPLFSPPAGEGSPFWQAISREFLERWAHQSQIRRALGRSSLATPDVLSVGVQVVATAAGEPVGAPDAPDGEWSVGPLVLGDSQQTADILTLAHTDDEVRALVAGPADLVARFAERLGRRLPD